MKELLDRMFGSVTVKVLLIGFFSLVLLVPMAMIEGLIRERGERMEAARAEIGNSWGNAQTIGAPMLIVPFRYSETVAESTRRVTDALYVLPESLSIDGDVETQMLRRGIYEVPVYTASLTISGVMPTPSFDGAYQDLEVLWSEAEVALPVSDPRPIGEMVRLRLADAEAAFEAGRAMSCFATAARAVVVPAEPLQVAPRTFALPEGLAAPGLRGGPLGARSCSADGGHQLVVPYSELGLGPLTAMQSFSVNLTIRGTGQLHFLPLGDINTVALRSPWPSPSFNGAFLPAEREVSGQGFTATWSVLGLGRGYPSTWLQSDGYQQVIGSSFGVDLLVPVGIHEASLRAAKYAVLFFGLTFLVYFLFEIFAALRLHALQYLSVGAANCMFFLLVLALGEHVGFGAAYLTSALASTLLIGAYSASILGAPGRALPVAGVLSLVYGYLYVTLKAEDYALVFGALGLFGVLAAFMLLTRRVDWFALSFEAPSKKEAPRMGASS